MKRRVWFVFFLCLAVAASHAYAKPYKGNKKKKYLPKEGSQPYDGPFFKFRLNDEERNILREYFKNRGASLRSVPKPGKKKKRLPPGLRKKLARGGQLPPGWQKKVARGEVLDEDLLAHALPLPDELLEKLPEQPPGTIIRTVEDKIVRILEATRTILDVLNL